MIWFRPPIDLMRIDNRPNPLFHLNFTQEQISETRERLEKEFKKYWNLV